MSSKDQPKAIMVGPPVDFPGGPPAQPDWEKRMCTGGCGTEVYLAPIDAAVAHELDAVVRCPSCVQK